MEALLVRFLGGFLALYMRYILYGKDAMEALLVRFCVECTMRYVCAVHALNTIPGMDAMEALSVRFCVEFVMRLSGAVQALYSRYLCGEYAQCFCGSVIYALYRRFFQ